MQTSNLSDQRILVGLLIAAAVAMLLTVQPSPHLCNDSTRLAFADALVNHGTFAIDGTYFESTCDRVTRNGKFYSDKPPVLSLGLAGVLWFVQTATGWRIPDDLSAVYQTITLLSSGIAWFVAFFGIIRWLALVGIDRRRAEIAAAVGLSTTLFFVFTTTINNHTVAGALLVWCLVHATPAPDGPGSHQHMAWLGFLAGLACVIDPLAVSFATPLVGFAMWERRRRLASLLPSAAGLVPIGVHVTLNLLSGAHPILVLDPEAFAFAGSMHDSTTMTGTAWKHDDLGDLVEYGFHSLIGHRGLFVYSPLAGAGLVGLALGLRRNEETRLRRLWWALSSGLVVFMLLTVGFSNNYSGWTYGVRWHCVAIPILVAGIALGDARLQGVARTRWRSICGVLALAGAALTGIGTIQPWTTVKSCGPQSSVVAVLSDSPVLVHGEARAASSMNRAGRHLEARLLAGYALRRNPRDKRALVAGLEAAIGLGDREDVGALWLMVRTVEWSASDYAYLERMSAQILDEIPGAQEQLAPQGETRQLLAPADLR